MRRCSPVVLRHQSPAELSIGQFRPCSPIDVWRSQDEISRRCPPQSRHTFENVRTGLQSELNLTHDVFQYVFCWRVWSPPKSLSTTRRSPLLCSPLQRHPACLRRRAGLRQGADLQHGKFFASASFGLRALSSERCLQRENGKDSVALIPPCIRGAGPDTGGFSDNVGPPAMPPLASSFTSLRPNRCTTCLLEQVAWPPAMMSSPGVCDLRQCFC